MSYSALVANEPRTLAFGLLQTIAATLGQTFVIALFLPPIMAELGFSERDIGVWFALPKSATALVLPAVGRLVDDLDAVMIVAAAVGPVLFGSLLSAGVRVEVLLGICVVAMLTATLLGSAALRAAPTRAEDFRV